jgi:hypothetical protein
MFPGCNTVIFFGYSLKFCLTMWCPFIFLFIYLNIWLHVLVNLSNLCGASCVVLDHVISFRNFFFHFFDEKGGPFANMTIHTPIESPYRVYSKHVVSKNILSGIWPKKLKTTLTYVFFEKFSILFMVAFRPGHSLCPDTALKEEPKSFQISD